MTPEGSLQTQTPKARAPSPSWCLLVWKVQLVMRLPWSRQQPWGWWILFKKIFPVDPSSIICINLLHYQNLRFMTWNSSLQNGPAWVTMVQIFSPILSWSRWSRLKVWKLFPFHNHLCNLALWFWLHLSFASSFSYRCMGVQEFHRVSMNINQKKSKEHIQTHHPAHTNTSKYMDIPEMPGGGSGFWCLSSGNCVAGGISRSFPLVAATPHGSQTFPNNNSQWVHMNTHLWADQMYISIYIYIYICVCDCVCMYMYLYICTYSFNMF